jgi:hypothetical protein
VKAPKPAGGDPSIDCVLTKACLTQLLVPDHAMLAPRQPR